METKMKVTKELIEEEFRNDPLFIANMLKSKDDLFPDFLETLYVDVQYSTKNAAELIGSLLEKGTENHIRYYMRSTNLEAYIQPMQKGRNLRLLYKSVYKLYLVSLYLSADEQRNLLDVKDLLPEYNVQPLIKGKKANAVNETSLEENRKNDEYYQAAMMSLVYSKESKEGVHQVSEFVSELWNDFITYVQVNKKLNKSLDEIYEKRKLLLKEQEKLNNLNIELINVKNILRDEAQFKNIQKIYRDFKDYQKENSSLLGRLFSKKKKEDDEFFTVKDDEPKIIALKEKIDEQEIVVSKLQNEIKKLEGARKVLELEQIEPDETRIEKMNLLMNSLKKDPVLNNQSELNYAHGNNSDEKSSEEQEFKTIGEEITIIEAK